jgi:DNA-binding LytR/AlgR family response regulator
MEKIKILLIEDPTQIEIALPLRLSEMGFEVAGVIAKPNEAASMLSQLEVDLVLMDIFLHEAYSGIDACKDIVAKFQIPVILLLSEEKLDFKILDHAPAYSLLSKPLNDWSLAFNIKAAVQPQSLPPIAKTGIDTKSQSYIFVRADLRLNKIRVKDIYYLEAKKDYVVIHTTDNVYTVHATMKDMELILPSDLFIRTHRSYIVNVDKVFSIKYPDILIEHKMKNIPIGGLYRKELFNKINVI